MASPALSSCLHASKGLPLSLRLLAREKAPLPIGIRTPHLSFGNPHRTKQAPGRTNLRVIQKPSRTRTAICFASSAKGRTPPDPPQDSNLPEKLASLGIFAFWGAWLAYGALAAPNQTPTIDRYLLEKLIGLRSDDGFVLNAVVVSLWNIMGLFPLLYTMLLIPASRTDRTSVPVWPFASISVFLGAFALLPYFALWAPGNPRIPSEEERQGWGLRVWESKITAGAMAVGALALVFNAASAPSGDWIEFNQIFRQSRLFHVTTSDFAVLTLSAPFWVYNDMAYRNWAPRDSWGLALLFFPVVGPFLYLVLRPGLTASKGDGK